MLTSDMHKIPLPPEERNPRAQYADLYITANIKNDYKKAIIRILKLVLW